MIRSRFQILGLTFFGLAWLSNDHYRPWLSFHGEALALAGLWLLALSCTLGAGRSLTAPLIAVAIAAIACLPWLQWVAGISPFAGDALMVSLYLCSLGAAVIVGYCWSTSAPAAESDHPFPAFMHVLWMAAMLSAAIGLAQWLGVAGMLQMYAPATDAGERAMGNLSQPNLLATLLLMGMAAYSLAYEKRVLGPGSFLLGIVFLSTVLVLTDSRAGLLNVVAIAAFLVWKNARVASRLAPTGVVLWAMGCWAARFLMPLARKAMLLDDGRGVALGDLDARWLIWKQVGYGIAQSPWFGYGWNQTPAAHAAGAVAFPGDNPYSYAHDVVLDLLAWNGIPLGLLVVGLCVWWVISRMHLVTQRHAVYAMAALLPIVIQSLLEFPFAYAYFLVAAGLLIGVVEATIGGHRRVAVPARWAWPGLVAWAVLGPWMIYEYLQIEKDFAVVRFESLRIGVTPGDYRPPHIHVLTHMGAMLRQARVQPTPGMTPQQLQQSEEVANRFPYGALALRHAVALGLNGDPAGASHEMAVLRGMYGEVYYAESRQVLRQQQQRYPQLEAVHTP